MTLTEHRFLWHFYDRTRAFSIRSSKIFGNRGFRPDFGDFDHHESKFGFGSAKELILTLTFAEAARGVQKTKTINVVDTCPKCRGSRSEPGTKPGKCQNCNGSGMETISTGPFIMRSSCRYCSGTGQHNRYPCVECDGKGSSVSSIHTILQSRFNEF